MIPLSCSFRAPFSPHATSSSPSGLSPSATMRLISLFLGVLAAAQCAHSFVVQRAPIGGRMPTSVARRAAVGPTMCVPKEVAAAILVVGAGFLLTQGVPPAKADMLSVSSSPSIGIVREASGSAQQVGDLELAMYLQAKTPPASSDYLAQAILDV